jgi:hypothetical protein
MDYASRERNCENLPAPMRSRQRRIAIVAQSTSSAEQYSGRRGGAIFFGTRTLEHSKKT